MKTISQLWMMLVSVLVISNCAGLSSPPPPPKPQTPLMLSAKSFREKALAYENSGDLRRALLAWQVAAKIKSDSPTKQAIDNLKQAIAAEAELHFKSGLSYYRFGKFTNATHAFLKALRVEPRHKGARYYLKTRLPMTRQTAYKVRRGDSYSKIAAQIYGDAKKAYLIAYFNDFDPVKPLLAGATLFLPVLDTRARQSKPNINIWASKAQKALDQKKYDAALDYVAKIKKELSGHPKALLISDKAHFAKATTFSANRQYLAALKHLKQVRPSFKGRNRAIARTRQLLLKQALKEKIELAETHVAQQAYDSAINVTKEILDQYPDNKRARALHNEARYTLAKQLLEGGEPGSAAELLKDADLSYQDTNQLLSLARARVKSRSEKHYRKGVNHFINEDLERAISEWRLALELDPAHPKARQDMENAVRLLEKYQTLETKP